MDISNYDDLKKRYAKRDDLEKRYSKLSNNELLELYENRARNTLMENHLAYSELRRRRLNKEDYDDFNTYKQREKRMLFYYMVLIIVFLSVVIYW